MPFYHKKKGEFGKRTTNQVTTKWFKELKLKDLERNGLQRLAQAKKRKEALDARNKHRSDAYLNKDLDRKRKIADEKRRTDSYNSAKLAREVVNTRVGRLDSWGRESVERARAYQALLQRKDDLEAERLRLEQEREHEGRKMMAEEERSMLQWLESTRTLAEQVLLRRSGFLEGKPRANPELTGMEKLDDVGFHVVNRARQNLHVIELRLYQPEAIRPDDDSDDDGEDGGELGNDEAAWQDDLPPKRLSVDLEKFPQAVELKCLRLNKEGIRLMCITIAPPPPKQLIASLRGSSVPDPIEILVPNLLHLNLERNNIQRMGMRALASCFERGACPKLKTLNLASNNIENCGISALCNAVMKTDGTVLKHLNTLVLRLNVVGDAGCCALTHILLQTHLPSLTNLDMKMNQIKYRGAHALLSYVASDTVRHKRFRQLNLSGNFIDRTKLGRFSRMTPKNCCL